MVKVTVRVAASVRDMVSSEDKVSVPLDAVLVPEDVCVPLSEKEPDGLSVTDGDGVVLSVRVHDTVGSLLRLTEAD